MEQKFINLHDEYTHAPLPTFHAGADFRRGGYALGW